jgi:hypothetical protein
MAKPMRPLRYSINVTLDGCCDHRVTYEMMEAAWRGPGGDGRTA